jgi:hypothetical protein
MLRKWVSWALAGYLAFCSFWQEASRPLRLRRFPHRWYPTVRAIQRLTNLGCCVFLFLVRSVRLPFRYFLVDIGFYSIEISIPFSIYICPIEIEPVLSVFESSHSTHIRSVGVRILGFGFLSVFPILFLRGKYSSVSQDRPKDNSIFYCRHVNFSLSHKSCQLHRGLQYEHLFVCDF